MISELERDNAALHSRVADLQTRLSDAIADNERMAIEVDTRQSGRRSRRRMPHLCGRHVHVSTPLSLARVQSGTRSDRRSRQRWKTSSNGLAVVSAQLLRWRRRWVWVWALLTGMTALAATSTNAGHFYGVGSHHCVFSGCTRARHGNFKR